MRIFSVFAAILHESSNNDQDLPRFDNYGLLGIYILEKILFHCYYVFKFHVYIGQKYGNFIVKIFIAKIECNCYIKFTKWNH